MITAMTARISEIKNVIGLGAESSSDMVLPFLLFSVRRLAFAVGGGTNLNGAGRPLRWTSTYGSGAANMRSAWVCTRNDVLGNLAVLLAALGVFGTGTGWPDIIVAATMAALALQGTWIVVSQSRAELRISASHDIVMGT